MSTTVRLPTVVPGPIRTPGISTAPCSTVAPSDTVAPAPITQNGRPRRRPDHRVVSDFRSGTQVGADSHERALANCDVGRYPRVVCDQALGWIFGASGSLRAPAARARATATSLAICP